MKSGAQPQDMIPLSAQCFHILVALADSDRHGYGIMQDVAERTGGKLRLSAGTLYGAIQRLLEQGLVVELPGVGSVERRRTYRLTPLGRKVVRAEAARMAEMVEQARAYGLAPKRA
jgi:DNA-binding PadR family transcriptional regulator